MIFDGMIYWAGDDSKPLAPGLVVEPRLKALNEWVRQVRGGVLTGVFTIENYLNVAITHFILGERAAELEVLETFSEGLLGPLTFDRRTNLIALIAPHMLPPDEATKLKSDLTEIRTLRNAMAHNPCWFQPETNDKGEVYDLMPMIMRGKSPIPLTSAFLEDLNSKIRSLIDRSEKLAFKAKHRQSAPASLEIAPSEPAR